jgi:peptidoglycan hydrolase-like protein with peptidoglycan-binding domain
VADFKLTRSQLQQGVTAPTGAANEVTLVADIQCVRLRGMFFDTNKNFILPATLDMLKTVKNVFDEGVATDLVIFGHTDTTGTAAINDPLSERRAKSVHAYLRDDVDFWLKQFETSVPESQRWGDLEDFLMLTKTDGFLERLPDGDPISTFQEARGLKVDGIAGPNTRRQLITEYMSVDGTTLPPALNVTVIGCGSDFPLDETGVNLDPNPGRPKPDQLDRRTELFFCAADVPDLPPKTRAAYPQWLQRAELREENAGTQIRVFRLNLLQLGKPLVDAVYTLEANGVLFAAGKSRAKGLVEALLLDGTTSVTVSVPSAQIRQEFRVVADTDFSPVSEVRGAQVRLAQLGFFAGDVDGEASELLDEAVTEFRREKGLPPGAARDAAFQAKLQEVYGS